jgi:hypothetical protein
MLKMLGYRLQANKKTLTAKPSHLDRDAQFEHINAEAKKAITAGLPVLSIGAKKNENIGNFKNNGRTYQIKRTPTKVLDHDIPIPELGKATPFGVYNIYKNQGYVNVDVSSDTAVFAVEPSENGGMQKENQNTQKLRKLLLRPIVVVATGIATGYGNLSFKD